MTLAVAVSVAVAVAVGVGVAQSGSASWASAGPVSRQTQMSSVSAAVTTPSTQSLHLDSSTAATPPSTREPSVSSCLRCGL